MFPEQKPFPIFGVLVPVVIFAAVLAGGATERLPQGIALAAMGALMIAVPPATWPERKWIAVVFVLLALATMGLWPAAWFRPAPWRAAVENAGVILPATFSPAPRLTLEAWLLLAAGIVWMSWLLALPWEARSRRLAARWFTAGTMVLAVLALVQWKLGWRPPGWLSDEGHGPFPNRNHTAHVLALGGVLAVGCAAEAAKRGRARAVPWLLAACVILAALAATFSRGGVLMFFAALALWNAAVAWQRRSAKILLLGLTALCLAAAAVLVFDGGVAGRLAGGKGLEVAFRFRIWEDTLAMIHASAWPGAGLGNFPGVFPLFRAESVLPSAVIHPESDWLWLAAEAGWLGAALGLAAAAIVLAGAWPLARGKQRRLRGAALAASIAAGLHSFFDVPGHRFGSALAALFVFALARKDARHGLPRVGETRAPRAFPGERATTALWRALGLALVALGAWRITCSDEAARAESLAHEGRFAAAAECASRTIARAPLDWRPYFLRAGALARSGHLLASVADFRRARALEPHFAAIPLEEGRFWIRLQPALAFAAWEEALRRAESAEAAGIFGQMITVVPDEPASRARLLALAEGRAILEMDWFLAVPLAEAKPHLAAMREIAERCDEARQKAFARRTAELGFPAPQ